MASNIPKGWKLIRLRDVIQECKERVGKKAAQVPVLSVTNSGGFQLSEEYFNKQVYSKDLANYKLVRRGQFAYNPSRVNVGSIDLLEEYDEGVLSPMYVVFSTDESKLLPEYLKYWTGTERFNGLVRTNTQGTVRDSLSFAALAPFPFFLPPLEEQRAIAVALRSVDETVLKTRKFIEGIQVVQEKFIGQLLSHGVPGKHKHFKKTSVGKIPESWNAVCMREIASIGSGSTPSRHCQDYWKDGTIPWVSSNKVHDGQIIEPSAYITEKAFREHRLRLLPKGTLVIALYGQGKTRATIAKLGITACINQALAYITVKKPVNASFLYAFLKNAYRRLRKLSHGSTQDNLNSQIIKSQ